MNQTKEQIQLSNFNHPAILIVGKMGSGKSTLGNMLLEGSNDNGPFETSSRFDSVTKVCNEGTVTINDNLYTIVDTPGIFDNNSPAETMISEIMSYVLRCAHGIKAIICVFEASRFGPEQERTLELLQKAFANGDLKNYVIVVFSKPTKGQMIDPNKMRQDWNTTFTTFIEFIDHRWGISPHFDIYAPDTEVHQNLLMKIRRLIINTPGVYTDERFEEARKKFEDAQRDKEIELDKARKQYENELMEIGEERARENYNLKSEKIIKKYQTELQFILFAAGSLIINVLGPVILAFCGFPNAAISSISSLWFL